MDDRQIKHMVSRFLGWKLPANFSPDCGIVFEPEHSAEYMAKQGKPPMRHEPNGTNLFTATQATEMVRWMVEGLPRSVEAVSLAEALRGMSARVGAPAAQMFLDAADFLDPPPKREPGFYWVKRVKGEGWQPAELETDGSWWLLGHTGGLAGVVLADIGPRLDNPPK
jgi:hypothetical protein